MMNYLREWADRARETPEEDRRLDRTDEDLTAGATVDEDLTVRDPLGELHPLMADGWDHADVADPRAPEATAWETTRADIEDAQTPRYTWEQTSPTPEDGHVYEITDPVGIAQYDDAHPLQSGAEGGEEVDLTPRIERIDEPALELDM